MPTFSGHDSFECRPFWLKKGLDHLSSDKKFDDSSVISLGVGKNMVTAISYWLKAFGVIDEKGKPTSFGTELLADGGYDPYLENESSLWLLHYHLVTKGHASIYQLMFNKYRRQKLEFSKEWLQRMISADFGDVSLNTLSKDIDTFIKTYSSRPEEGEESYGGLLAELELLSVVRKEDRKIIYTLQNARAEQIAPEVLLYCILDFAEGKNSLGFEQLLTDPNSIGSVFCLNREDLAKALERLAEELHGYGIVYSDHAGVKELQFKKTIVKGNVLKKYYKLTHV